MPFTRRDFLRTAALGVASLPGAALPRGPGSSGSSGEFSGLDATDLAGLVRMRKVSASELLEDIIRRLEAVNPKLNAVIAKTYERAPGRAGAMGSAGSETEGAFAGVPWLLKDISECKGLPMTMGSRALRGIVSQVDVPFVSAAEAAGLNIVGITNVPEFGLSDNSGNLLYGATHNPWGVAYGAAGSSSGPAAAVAAGIVPMAHGNDGGGSLRCPASACGLFTLKVSRGRHLPAHTANFPYDIGQDGVLSRSVRDNARFLSIGEDRNTSLPMLGFVAGPSGRKLKIGVLLDVGNGVALDPAVADAMAETVKLCEDLGHVVAPVVLPFDYARLIEAFWGVWRAGAALTVGGIAAAMALPVNESHFEPWTLGLRAHANSHPGGPRALLAAAGPVFEEASARMERLRHASRAICRPSGAAPGAAASKCREKLRFVPSSRLLDRRCSVSQRFGTRPIYPGSGEVDLATYSHSIINSFGKSLSGLMLASQRLRFTAIFTVILTGIPKRSIHHQSTSIEDSRCFHDGQLSRSIPISTPPRGRSMIGSAKDIPFT